jgi:hypothetical protein
LTCCTSYGYADGLFAHGNNSRKVVKTAAVQEPTQNG